MGRNTLDPLGPHPEGGSFLVYLSSGPPQETGGRTIFPLVKHFERPVAGQAIVWRNTTESGEGEPLSVHRGEAPVHFTKYVATVWVREAPFVNRIDALNDLENQKK